MQQVMDWSVMMVEAEFWWLLIWSWQAAVVVACVWLGLKLFRVQSPALRHQVWLLGLIAVAVLPIWSLIVQFLPVPRPTGEALISVADLPRTIAGTGSPQSAFAISTSPESSSVGGKAFPVTIWSLLFMGWIAGAVIFFFRIIRDAMHMSRLCSQAQPVRLEDLDCGDCQHIADGIGHIRIAFHELVGSPILAGIWRPSILLPGDFARWTTAAERRAIIEHEIAHLSRLDHYVNLFLRILNAVFYFHPLVIFARRQLEIEREMACDDRVIDRGTSEEIYAESILKVAGRGVMFQGRHQLGMVSSKQVLEKRIGMIINKDRVRYVTHYRRKLILSAVLVSLVIWMITPAHSERAMFGLSSQSSRRNSEINSVIAYVMLTAEQKEQLKQASRPLSEGLPRLISSSSEEFAKWVWNSGTNKGFYRSSDGKYVGWGNNFALRGYIRNASPLSPRLAFKTLGFDRSVTVELTEEQRRQFNRIFHRSITGLSFEPTEEYRFYIYQRERGFRGALEKLKNTIEPDAYWVSFYSTPEEDLKMEVEAHYRQHRLLGGDWHVHNLWSLFYPNLYPSRRHLSDEETGDVPLNLPPPPIGAFKK